MPKTKRSSGTSPKGHQDVHGGHGPSRGMNPPGSLRLVRTETSGERGVLLVFDASDGAERSWLLQETSVVELLALLLGGRIGNGRRVVLDAEAVLEPPERAGGDPHLCFNVGLLEGCIAADVEVLKSLRRDIDRLVPRS